MKILNPNEYKSQNPNAYLDDYLSYLEDAQKAAEETLQSAKSLLDDNSILEDIRTQAEEIFQMAMLVEEYMGQIVLKSIDTLSLEELQSYFNFDSENEQADEQKEKLEEEKSNIKSRLDEIEKQIASNLYANGRVKDFYELDDVKIFFQENPNPDQFLEDLLSSFEDNSTNKIVDTFKKQLTVVLKTESQIQSIELSTTDIDELVEKIIDLFRTCKNILSYTPDAKTQLTKAILSESGIKQILPGTFDENTALYIIHDLMNLKKLNTAFYTNLPSSLQEKLANGRLQGETYETLLKTYQAFLSGEVLPSDDLSQEEKEEKKELEGKLEKVNYDLASVDAEKESHQKFLTNAEAMRSILREMILEELHGQVSAKDIDSIIKEAEKKAEKLKTELEEANKLLSTKTRDLEKAQEILLDSEYHYFFQSVEQNNVRRLYKAFGVNVTEEVILPFLEEEKRRYRQIDIMVTLQNTLSSIYGSIKEKEEKSNFITRNLPAYKESLKQLNEKYQKAIEEAFQNLKQNRLFSINAPQISNESTLGNVIILPSANQQLEPTSFSEMSGLKQSFWNMSTGIDENTKQRFLAMNTETDWETYYQNLMKKQAELVTKLLSFEVGNDGYYTFASSKEEREELKHLQTTIIEILSSIYEERRSFRQSLGDMPTILEAEKVEELEYFLGHGANLSRENLVSYIDQTQNKIESLKALLLNNRSLCLKLGIELPDDGTIIINDASEEENNTLENRIQSLNIDGVTNLEEAIAYRNLLLGLEEYTVPPTKVKQFYLEHKKK